MPIFTASELADLRATALEFLDLEATIQTRALTDDGEGGQLESFTDGATVPCRLDLPGTAPGATAAVEGGAVAATEFWRLSLPLSVSLASGDRVEIDGAAYTVISDTGTRSHAAVRRYLVRRA